MAYPNTMEYVYITGTGDFPLAGALDGHNRVGEQYNTNDTFRYRIEHTTLNEWEEGTGTYNEGTNVVARTTVTASSNSGNKVAFGAGEKIIEINPRVQVPVTNSDPSGTREGELIYSGGTLKINNGSALVNPATPLVSIYQFREAASGATDSITAGAWRKVPLATAVHEGITGVSLSDGTVTLSAGTYIMEYGSQAYAANVQGGALTAQVRLYNGSAEVTGSGGSFAQAGDALGAAATDVTAITRGTCKVTLTEETTIDLEIQTSINATYGAASYATQVCAELKITKVS